MTRGHLKLASEVRSVIPADSYVGRSGKSNSTDYVLWSGHVRSILYQKWLKGAEEIRFIIHLSLIHLEGADSLDTNSFKRYVDSFHEEVPFGPCKFFRTLLIEVEAVINSRSLTSNTLYDPMSERSTVSNQMLTTMLYLLCVVSSRKRTFIAANVGVEYSILQTSFGLSTGVSRNAAISS